MAPIEKIFTHRSRRCYSFSLSYFVRQPFIVRNTHTKSTSVEHRYNSKRTSVLRNTTQHWIHLVATLSNSEGELRSTISIGNGVSTRLLDSIEQRFVFFSRFFQFIYINHQSFGLWNNMKWKQNIFFHVKGLYLQWHKGVIWIVVFSGPIVQYFITFTIRKE